MKKKKIIIIFCSIIFVSLIILSFLTSNSKRDYYDFKEVDEETKEKLRNYPFVDCNIIFGGQGNLDELNLFYNDFYIKSCSPKLYYDTALIYYGNLEKYYFIYQDNKTYTDELYSLNHSKLLLSKACYVFSDESIIDGKTFANHGIDGYVRNELKQNLLIYENDRYDDVPINYNGYHLAACIGYKRGEVKKNISKNVDINQSFDFYFVINLKNENGINTIIDNSIYTKRDYYVGYRIENIGKDFKKIIYTSDYFTYNISATIEVRDENVYIPVSYVNEDDFKQIGMDKKIIDISILEDEYYICSLNDISKLIYDTNKEHEE